MPIGAKSEKGQDFIPLELALSEYLLVDDIKNARLHIGNQNFDLIKNSILSKKAHIILHNKSYITFISCIFLLVTSLCLNNIHKIFLSVILPASMLFFVLSIFSIICFRRSNITPSTSELIQKSPLENKLEILSLIDFSEHMKLHNPSTYVRDDGIKGSYAKRSLSRIFKSEFGPVELIKASLHAEGVTLPSFVRPGVKIYIDRNKTPERSNLYNLFYSTLRDHNLFKTLSEDELHKVENFLKNEKLHDRIWSNYLIVHLAYERRRKAQGKAPAHKEVYSLPEVTPALLSDDTVRALLSPNKDHPIRKRLRIAALAARDANI